MSFKEVKDLRKSGRLEEALSLAKQDLESDPNDIWNKRSISWVLYDYLKKNSSSNNFENFMLHFNGLIELGLPEEEKMVFENSTWQLVKLVFSIQKTTPVDFAKINQLFDSIRDFPFSKPSESFSALFNAFLRLNKEWPRYIECAEWWNFDNFRSQDYLKEELPNGKSVISIAERAYIAYARKLIEFIASGEVNQDEIDNFSAKLDQLIEDHPEYQYPPYFKAKLLLASGGGQEGLIAFLPFARKKRNDFWVWDVLSDIFSDNEEKRLACLCRGMLCKSSGEFLIKLREKLANILISKGLYEEASFEVFKIFEVRLANNWRIEGKLLEWMNTSWYKLENSEKDNSSFYKEKSRLADEILFQDLPEENVVVEHVNKHKKILNFIIDKNNHGFFKYERYLDKVEIGDVLKVRFDGEGKDDYYKVFTAKRTNEIPDNSIIKEFSGKIRRRENQSFAFVDDIFIEPQIVDKHHIEDDTPITGRAIISFNKKKNEWGWKCFIIDNQ